MPDAKEEDAKQPGLDKQELKKLLRMARRQPMNCAVGTGPDGCLIVLDRVTPPKTLLAQLKKDCPQLRTPCFGTAAVSAAEDPKLVTFQLNRTLQGFQRRLRLTLKGTGFTKVAVERTPAQDRES